MDRRTINISIKSVYYLQISIGFNKPLHLLWQQRAGGSNPSAPTIIYQHFASISVSR